MLHSLQACRAVAALLVVLLHTSQGIFFQPKYFGHKPYGLVFDFGLAGVNFFFVLSGFLMMHVHARDFGQPNRFGNYAWKRFSRIYPPYWVALTLVVPVYFLSPGMGHGHERELSSFLHSYTLIPHAHPEETLVLGVAWTLVYEVFFYVLFGLLILNRTLGVIAFAIWTLGTFAYAQFTEFPGDFFFSYFGLYFLTGIAVAFLHGRFRVPYPLALATLGALLYFGTGYVDIYRGPLELHSKTAGIALGCAGITLGLVQAEQREILRIPRWIAFLGNASYSIYLIHFPILSLTAKLVKSARLDEMIPATILFWLFVLAATGGGCAFHLLIERPLLNRLKGRYRTARAASP